jgi:hypothetical protein
MKAMQQVTAMLLLIWLALPALAQRSDPLTREEVDQLRDAAVDPEPRMKLYVEFARARLVKLEQMRSDPKVTDRAHQTHNLLEQFLTVYNELNDNLENFEGRQADLRKALKHVIEGDTEFQAKLRALKSDDRTTRQEAAEYEFVLSSAIDTVDSGVDDHRKLLTEQEELWKHRKKGKS